MSRNATRICTISRKIFLSLTIAMFSMVIIASCEASSFSGDETTVKDIEELETDEPAAKKVDEIEILPLRTAGIDEKSLSPKMEADFAHNQVLIQFEGSASEAEREAYIQSVGGLVLDMIEELNTVLVEVRSDEFMRALDVVEEGIVKHSELNYKYAATGVFKTPLNDITNDPLLDQQWALDALDAPAVLAGQSKSYEIAILDSGSCPSLSEANAGIHTLIYGYDYVDDDDAPWDENGHGCAVQGILGAGWNNGIGISGFLGDLPRVKIFRVLDENGSGVTSDIAAAIVSAVDSNDVKVINLSFGSPYPSFVLESAVQYAIERGVYVVAAAGNDGGSNPFYPAAFPGVIGVGSVDSDLSRSSFSNYGDYVDVWAPGDNILTTTLDDEYSYWSGTSFAASYVTGFLQMGYDLNDWSLGGYQGFIDVAPGDELTDYIMALYNAGITSGCSTDPLKFCPVTIMDRSMVSVFMLRGQFGSGYTPSPATGTLFADMTNTGSWAAPWVEAMYTEGLSAGCSSDPLKYCPLSQMTVQEASVFALRLKYGVSYSPSPATGMIFADMTNPNSWATPWCEQAYLDGLLPQCGWDDSVDKPLYCPTELIDRSWGAYMVVQAKGLLD